MALKAATKNLMLEELRGVLGWVSAHDDDPETTGLNELAGGGYGRVAITWAAATGGHLSSSNTPAITVPATETVRYLGLWSSSSGGIFYGAFPVSTETFGGPGFLRILTLLLDAFADPVPPPPTGNPPPNGIVVNPGNFLAAEAANPAGSAFILTAGTYPTPNLKNDNWYWSQTPLGAHFQGQGINGGPFKGGSKNVDGVRLSRVWISHYGPDTADQNGAMIRGNGNSVDWIIEDSLLERTGNVLVRWDAGWIVRRTTMRYAGRYAMAGGSNNGSKLCEDVIWEDICNDTGGVPATGDSDRGGNKFAHTSHITLRRHQVSRTGKNGVWWDIANVDGVMEGAGLIEDCPQNGLDLEISYGPFRIDDLVVRRCNTRIPPTNLTQSGPASIMISNTPKVTINRAHVSHGVRGICPWQFSHSGITDPALDGSRMGLDDILVRNSTITDISASYNTLNNGAASYDAGFNGSYQPGTLGAEAGAVGNAKVRYENCAFDPGAVLLRGTFV